ncbi:uncharacterized protein METZ01_LOCUS115759, partial [marine metagenome]
MASSASTLSTGAVQVRFWQTQAWFPSRPSHSGPGRRSPQARTVLG